MFTSVLLCLGCGSLGALLGPMVSEVLKEVRSQKAKLYKASQDVLLPPPLSGQEGIPSLRVPREFESGGMQ